MNTIELLNTIKRIALSQQTCNSAFDGDVYDNWNSSEIKYGSVNAAITKIESEDQIFTYTVYLYYGDRLTQDKSNVNGIVTDGVNTLQSIINILDKQDYIDVTGVINFIPFEQKFMDYLAGVYCEITINTTSSLGECEMDSYTYTDDKDAIIAELTQELTEARSEILILNQTIKSLEADVTSLTAQISTLNRELEEDAAIISGLQAEIVDKNQTISQLQEQVSSLTYQISIKDLRISELEQEISSVTSTYITGNGIYLPPSGVLGWNIVEVAVPSDRKTEIALNETLTQNGPITFTPPAGSVYSGVTIDVAVPSPSIRLEDKNVTENGRYEHGQGYDGLGVVNVSVETYYDELTAVTAELETTQAELTATTAELETTEAELTATTAELETTQAELTSTTAELETTQAQLTSTTAQLETTQAELTATTAELETTEAELTATTAQLETTQAELTATTVELETTEAELTAVTAEYNDYVSGVQADVIDCYTAASGKGATLPQQQTLDNLASTISTIPTGSTGGFNMANVTGLEITDATGTIDLSTFNNSNNLVNLRINATGVTQVDGLSALNKSSLKWLHLGYSSNSIDVSGYSFPSAQEHLIYNPDTYTYYGQPVLAFSKIVPLDLASCICKHQAIYANNVTIGTSGHTYSMAYAFSNAYGYSMSSAVTTTISLTGSTMERVDDLRHAFEGQSALTSLYLTNTGKVSDWRYAFYDVKLANNSQVRSTIEGLNTAYATYLDGMLAASTSEIGAEYSLDLSGWNAPISTATKLFYNRAKLQSLNLIGWRGADLNTSRLSYAFYGCSSLTSLVGNYSITAVINSNLKVFDGLNQDLDLTSTNGNDVSGLNRASLRAIINGLENRMYESSGCVLKIGTTAKSTLTSADIAVATGKNWTIQ